MYSDSLRNQCGDGSVCSRLEQKFGDVRGLQLERRALLEGRWGEAKDHITGDLNVELGMMCTDENDIEELTGIFGLLCWQEYDKDPGGFKKLMREFNCKASSTWSVRGTERDDGFALGHSSPGMKQETAQQDYIIGPARRDDEMHIHNEERIWATWNHCYIFARTQEEGRTKKFKKGMKKK